ncbi:MAG: helix-turn-helix domain-containing protein [Halodesulfurarchaeum sp.]
MPRIDDVSLAELREALDEFDDRRPMLRLVAAVLYKQGPSVPEIAAWLDVREATVYDWFDRLEGAEDLDAAVRDSPRPGRPAKLDPEMRAAALSDLAGSPRDVGVEAAEWTPELARQHLEERYGVSYSRRHASRLLADASEF